MKRLQECIPLGPPPLSEEDGAGEGDRGLALCRAKGYEESEGRVVAMPGQMPTKNRKNRRGGERGGGSWAMDPVASRDGHRARAGRGWRGEGLKLGRMM